MIMLLARKSFRPAWNVQKANIAIIIRFIEFERIELVPTPAQIIISSSVLQSRYVRVFLMRYEFFSMSYGGRLRCRCDGR